MVEYGLWILAGDDEEAKEKKLGHLAQQAFPPELKDLNTSVFHGDDKLLTPARLAEAILAQPTFGARRRLILIRCAEKLSRTCLEGLEKIAKRLPEAVVVFETADPDAGEALARRFQGASVLRFQKTKPPDVFDLGRAVLGRRSDEALKILSSLRRRERPEKIVGGLFWQWERSFREKKISPQSYQQGVRFFSDADRRLKSSSSVLAREMLILETLVVKLAYTGAETCLPTASPQGKPARQAKTGAAGAGRVAGSFS